MSNNLMGTFNDAKTAFNNRDAATILTLLCPDTPSPPAPPQYPRVYDLKKNLQAMGRAAVIGYLESQFLSQPNFDPIPGETQSNISGQKGMVWGKANWTDNDPAPDGRIQFQFTFQQQANGLWLITQLWGSADLTR